MCKSQGHGAETPSVEVAVNEKRARFDALTPVSVSTSEVKAIGWGDGFKQRVLGWLMPKKVFGEYRNTDKGWDITFNKKGARNVMAHNANDDTVALLEHIPYLIKHGIFLETIPKSDVLDSHIFAAKATIDGEAATIGIVIRDDVNGKRYYDHTIITENGARVETGLVLHTTTENLPENPNSIHNILKKHLGVNSGVKNIS